MLAEGTELSEVRCGDLNVLEARWQEQAENGGRGQSEWAAMAVETV